MVRTRSLAARQADDPQNPGGFTHTPALDGIRGLAILLVLFFHLFWSNSETGSRLFDIFNQLRASCYIGVNLFFVLSGFLITGILLDTLHVPRFFKTFYARRALRIFPLYYGVITALLLLSRPLHFIWNGWQYYFLTYTSNLVLWHRSPLILHHFDIGHLWSLQVEEQFYLVWPFLVYRLKRPWALVRYSLVGCAIVLLIRVSLVYLPQHPNLNFTYWPTFSCADNLLYGCCLCAVLRTSLRQRILKLAPGVFLFGMAVLVVAGVVYQGLIPNTNHFIPTLGFSTVGISAAALIAMALRPDSRTERIFSNRILRFLGKYSYGLYVFHFTLDSELKIPLREFFHIHGCTKAVGVLLAAVIVFGLTLLVSLISYHFYEAPFLKLKRYFSYNRPPISSRQTQPAVVN